VVMVNIHSNLKQLKSTQAGQVVISDR
jgi:hypothetical protein